MSRTRNHAKDDDAKDAQGIMQTRIRITKHACMHLPGRTRLVLAHVAATRKRRKRVSTSVPHQSPHAAAHTYTPRGMWAASDSEQQRMHAGIYRRFELTPV